MDNIKKYYNEGLNLLEKEYGLYMSCISVCIVCLLVIWRFFPNYFQLVGIVFQLIFSYILISGILYKNGIKVFANIITKMILVTIGLLVFVKKCKPEEYLRFIQMVTIIVGSSYIYYALLMYNHFLKIPKKEIRTVKNIYAILLYIAPIIVAMMNFLPFGIIILLIIYVAVLPLETYALYRIGAFEGIVYF